MKFEKVNNDKIKITLSTADLEANDIDFHSFMSNSSETQSLFLTVLDKAEKDYGFCTDNYHLRVETLALDNGSFILTITRMQDSGAPSSPTKKRLKVSRKNHVNTPEFASLVYRFNSFDDFCGFVDFLHNSKLPSLNTIAKNTVLYFYNNCYYLIFDNVNAKYLHWKVVYSAITEFGAYVTPRQTFIAKLYEVGKVVIKNNAIKTCEKYFL